MNIPHSVPAQPAENDSVPWAVRYTLVIAALAVVALLAFVGWALTL